MNAMTLAIQRFLNAAGSHFQGLSTNQTCIATGVNSSPLSVGDGRPYTVMNVARNQGEFDALHALESGEFLYVTVGGISLYQYDALIDNGFYGEVPAAELINGPDLADLAGLTVGNDLYPNEPWLRFSLDGTMLYIAKRPLRNLISWQQLRDAGLMYGDTTVQIHGRDYRIRLPKGANADPTTGSLATPDPAGTHGSEWNRLMYHITDISTLGPDQTFASEGIATGDWAQYDGSELNFIEGPSVPGGNSICQEVFSSLPDYIVARTASRVVSPHKQHNIATNGWRPVLEFDGEWQDSPYVGQPWIIQPNTIVYSPFNQTPFYVDENMQFIAVDNQP